MRSKSCWLNDISLSRSVSCCMTFFSVSAMTGVLCALVSPKNTLLTRSSRFPLSSYARMVFWKVGFFLLFTILLMFSRCSLMPASMAGR